MAGNNIMVGAKIELTKLNEGKSRKLEKSRIYYSKVLDVEETEDGMLVKASMPIFEGHIVPLTVGTQYAVFFSTGGNIVESTCKVIGRTKEMNIYVMDLLITGELKRVQRREYYRFPCYMEVILQPVDEWQAAEYEHTHEWSKKTGADEPRKSSGLLTDLSGGGIRLHSDEHFDKDTYVKICFDIFYDDTKRSFKLLGQIIESYSVERNRGGFETRIKFVAMPKEEKETIIKYIFKEQRIAARTKRLTD